MRLGWVSLLVAVWMRSGRYHCIIASLYHDIVVIALLLINLPREVVTNRYSMQLAPPHHHTTCSRTNTPMEHRVATSVVDLPRENKSRSERQGTRDERQGDIDERR